MPIVTSTVEPKRETIPTPTPERAGSVAAIVSAAEREKAANEKAAATLIRFGHDEEPAATYHRSRTDNVTELKDALTILYANHVGKDLSEDISAIASRRSDPTIPAEPLKNLQIAAFASGWSKPHRKVVLEVLRNIHHESGGYANPPEDVDLLAAHMNEPMKRAYPKLDEGDLRHDLGVVQAALRKEKLPKVSSIRNRQIKDVVQNWTLPQAQAAEKAMVGVYQQYRNEKARAVEMEWGDSGRPRKAASGPPPTPEEVARKFGAKMHELYIPYQTGKADPRPGASQAIDRQESEMATQVRLIAEPHRNAKRRRDAESGNLAGLRQEQVDAQNSRPVVAVKKREPRFMDGERAFAIANRLSNRSDADREIGKDLHRLRDFCSGYFRDRTVNPTGYLEEAKPLRQELASSIGDHYAGRTQSLLHDLKAIDRAIITNKFDDLPKDIDDQTLCGHVSHCLADKTTWDRSHQAPFSYLMILQASLNDALRTALGDRGASVPPCLKDEIHQPKAYEDRRYPWVRGEAKPDPMLATAECRESSYELLRANPLDIDYINNFAKFLGSHHYTEKNYSSLMQDLRGLFYECKDREVADTFQNVLPVRWQHYYSSRAKYNQDIELLNTEYRKADDRSTRGFDDPVLAEHVKKSDADRLRGTVRALVETARWIGTDFRVSHFLTPAPASASAAADDTSAMSAMHASSIERGQSESKEPEDAAGVAANRVIASTVVGHVPLHSFARPRSNAYMDVDVEEPTESRRAPLAAGRAEPPGHDRASRAGTSANAPLSRTSRQESRSRPSSRPTARPIAGPTAGPTAQSSSGSSSGPTARSSSGPTSGPSSNRRPTLKDKLSALLPFSKKQ